MPEEKDATNDNSESEKSNENEQTDKGNLTAPEGVLMLCVATLLDGIGLILFFLSWLGVDDYGLLDIIGGVIIGGWLYFRKGTISPKMLRRFLIAFGVEVVPILGSVSPSWMILVWQELKS